MLLKLLGLIAKVGAGFGLARAPFKISLGTAILTGLLATGAHAILRFALPHDVIEEVAQAHLYTGSGQIVLIVVAVVETAGVLFPVALMPWANGSSRAWATLYVVGAAILSAVVYYFPFDVVIVNDKVIGPKHAAYELGLLVWLPFGVIGYLVGWLGRRHDARSRALVRPLVLTGHVNGCGTTHSVREYNVHERSVCYARQ